MSVLLEYLYFLLANTVVISECSLYFTAKKFNLARLTVKTGILSPIVQKCSSQIEFMEHPSQWSYLSDKIILIW